MIAAVLAAVVSLIAGYPGAAIVLMAGVALHGVGWYYLYVTRDRRSAQDGGPGTTFGDTSET